MNWQRVIEIGWHLLTKADMERFEQMCEDESGAKQLWNL
jgi:hypothetical protein